MSRDNSKLKGAYNRLLDLIGRIGTGGQLPTEVELSESLAISRTTVRGILGGLDEAGIIRWAGREKTILRVPSADEYYPKSETTSVADRLSAQFMAYIFDADLAPGSVLREADLVKKFGVSSSAVREFMIRFSRFGLIAKEPNRHWVLRGFTREFAEELFDMRQMLEERAFQTFLKNRSPDDAARPLVRLRAEHEAILADIDGNYLKFPRLDERFHRIWIDAYGNRFVLDFFELVSLVFHYHYRWSRQSEKDRNRDAIVEHLRIIDAIADGHPEDGHRLFRDHLERARETMIASAIWD